MAKDTEKLIRQLSLISFLMAERRPVSALEIRRDVEGYSEMNEDAFARRFYADRAELESARHPAHGRQARRGRRRAGELLAAAGELLPAGDRVHRRGARRRCRPRSACSTASSPTPSRCGSRCSRSRGAGRARSSRPTSARSRSAITASAGGHELSQRLAKIETAIFRRKTIEFDYYTMERDATGARKVDPYHLLFRGGQFYLIGHSHERDAIRVFRLSRIRGKVAYATKAEHDFKRARRTSTRATTPRAPTGSSATTDGHRRDLRSRERIAWLVERHFGALRRGPRRRDDERRRHRLRDAVRVRAPAGLLGARARRARARRRPGRARRRGRGAPRAARASRHEGELELADAGRRHAAAAPSAERRGRRARAPRGRDPPRALRPPGHARRRS